MGGHRGLETAGRGGEKEEEDLREQEETIRISFEVFTIAHNQLDTEMESTFFYFPKVTSVSNNLTNLIIYLDKA